VTDVQDFTFEASAEAERLRRAFETFGVVVIKKLLSSDKLSEQRAAVNRLLAIRLQRLGHALVSDDIDDNLNALVELDQRHAMDIIRAIKDSPFFYAILADTRLHDISKACLNCETLLSIHDIAQFRIDPPNHDERNFEWHQDFQYNVMSMNSATIWYPLKRVSEEMGPLVVVPGSHRTIVPVEMNFEGHKPGSGLMHAVLRFQVDEFEAERKAVVLCPVEEGDVVVFHSLMLHRSSANRSNRSRWTVNPRFGDAADPAFADRGWLAVRDRTQRAFADYYPQYVKVSGS
jgi:ectoine hydroxylase-related dioxygenase (phytanoyl-CoA dioxygenase family)